jgi:hypothetical protein
MFSLSLLGFVIPVKRTRKPKQPTAGFLRPEAVVLGKDALVPDRNLIVPAPNEFTHELTQPQPFYFTSATQADTPNGQLPAGTRVVLLVHGDGPYCRVVDGQGLYVEVEYAGLKKL